MNYKLEKRSLNIPGQLEVSYDFKYDVLLFKLKNREYKRSVEFQNFVADIDEEGYVTGAQIFDASKAFNIDKYLLRNVHHAHFKAHAENNVITIILNFNIILRNRIIPLLSREKSFTQQFIASTTNLKDSSVESSVA